MSAFRPLAHCVSPECVSSPLLLKSAESDVYDGIVMMIYHTITLYTV